jgi:hypothetical protein
VGFDISKGREEGGTKNHHVPSNTGKPSSRTMLDKRR